MSQKTFTGRLTELPEIMCTCRSRTSGRSDIIKTYIKEGHEIGKRIAAKRDQGIERIQKDIKKGNERRLALRKLEQDLKIEMGRELSKVFTELWIDEPCCRILLADNARRGVLCPVDDPQELNDEEYEKCFFDPENYYTINAFSSSDASRVFSNFENMQI